MKKYYIVSRLPPCFPLLAPSLHSTSHLLTVRLFTWASALNVRVTSCSEGPWSFIFLLSHIALLEGCFSTSLELYIVGMDYRLVLDELSRTLSLQEGNKANTVK